jgi:ATP-dependent DNA helicase RecG
VLGLLENPTVEEILRQKEGQFFDRKSARIEPRDLANHIIAFANADGGFIVVGIENDHKITGLNDYPTKLGAFLQAPWDLCVPAVMTEHKFIYCFNNRGQADKVLLFEILQSGKLHTNAKDEVYLRLGDKSRKVHYQAQSGHFRDHIREVSA